MRPTRQVAVNGGIPQMRSLKLTLALASLGGLLAFASCTLITDVDRSKIPNPDASTGEEAGESNGGGSTPGGGGSTSVGGTTGEAGEPGEAGQTSGGTSGGGAGGSAGGPTPDAGAGGD